MNPLLFIGLMACIPTVYRYPAELGDELEVQAWRDVEGMDSESVAGSDLESVDPGWTDWWESGAPAPEIERASLHWPWNSPSRVTAAPGSPPTQRVGVLARSDEDPTYRFRWRQRLAERRASEPEEAIVEAEAGSPWNAEPSPDLEPPPEEAPAAEAPAAEAPVAEAPVSAEQARRGWRRKSPKTVAEPSPAPRKPAAKARREASGGDAVARGAAHYIGKNTLTCDGERYRYDCSGFVDAAHARAGIDLAHKNTEALHALAKEYGVHSRTHRPQPGDVIFFDNTYDANRNGRLDDELSHVGIVEKIDEDGTIALVHKGSKGVVRIWMNLDHPGERSGPDGKIYNSYLRARTSKDPRGTQYMAGELWRGSASFWAVPELRTDATSDSE